MQVPTLPYPASLSNDELAGIEFDELAYETVPAYRDWFCGVIEECARRRRLKEQGPHDGHS
jgi:hypothetical protein